MILLMLRVEVGTVTRKRIQLKECVIKSRSGTRLLHFFLIGRKGVLQPHGKPDLGKFWRIWRSRSLRWRVPRSFPRHCQGQWWCSIVQGWSTFTTRVTSGSQTARVGPYSLVQDNQYQWYNDTYRYPPGMMILVAALKETLRTVPFMPALGNGGPDFASQKGLWNPRAYVADPLAPL